MNPTNNTIENPTRSENISETAKNKLKKAGALVLLLTTLVTASGCSSQENKSAENLDPSKKIESYYENFNLNKDIIKVSVEEDTRARATPYVKNGTNSDPNTNIVAILPEGTIDTPHGVKNVEESDNGPFVGVLTEDIKNEYPDVNIPDEYKIVYISAQKYRLTYATSAPQVTNDKK